MIYLFIIIILIIFWSDGKLLIGYHFIIYYFYFKEFVFKKTYRAFTMYYIYNFKNILYFLLTFVKLN